MLQKLKERIEHLRNTTQDTVIDLITNRVSDDIQQYRYSICQECPKLYKPTDTCKACGCFMKVKTLLPKVSCPLGKWTSIEE